MTLLTLLLLHAAPAAAQNATTAAPAGRVVDARGQEIAEADWPPLVKARIGQIRNSIFRMGEPYVHGSVVLARGVPRDESAVTMQLVGAAWVGASLIWPKGDPGDHVIGLCLVEKGGPFHLEVSAAGHATVRRELPDVMGALIWMGDIPLPLASQDAASPLTGSIQPVETTPATTR